MTRPLHASRTTVCISLICVLAFGCGGGNHEPRTRRDAGPLVDTGTGDFSFEDNATTIDVGPRDPLAQRGLNFVKTVVGEWHSCALTDTNEVYCWGDDTNLQLGEGLTQRHLCARRRRVCRPFAEAVAQFEGAIDIAADDETTCALMADGTVHCTGQLPTPLPDLPPFVRIEMGGDVLCGITEDGGLVCMDPFRQLRVREDIGVTDVAMGREHYCYLKEGRVWCGGRSQDGELAEPFGHECEGLAPGERCDEGNWVSLFGEVVDVEVGKGSSCARVSDDQVYCWGYIDEPRTPPTLLPGLEGPARGLIVGEGVWCSHGVDGSITCHERIPEYRPPHFDALVSIDIDASSNHGCLTLGNGTLYCWGDDSAGQVGLGVLENVTREALLVKIGAPADWEPRPDPMPAEEGWAPYPTLPPTCLIEHAEDLSSLPTFVVEPCGASTCVRPPEDGDEWIFGGSIGAPARGGVLSFTRLGTYHRMHGLVSMQTGEVLAAVRSPLDPLQTTAGFCMIEQVVVGEDAAQFIVRADPLPRRVVRVPFELSRETPMPTSITVAAPADVSGHAMGADVAAWIADDTLELRRDGVVRTYGFANEASIAVEGSTTVWAASGDVLYGAEGLGEATTLVEVHDARIIGAAISADHIAWLEESERGLQLWAASREGLVLSERRFLGTVDATGPIAVGSGEVAYIASNGDLVLRNVESPQERRLAPATRWGELWDIEGGKVLTGGPAVTAARTLVRDIPLVE